jgi:hypothetical protein
MYVEFHRFLSLAYLVSAVRWHSPLLRPPPLPLSRSTSPTVRNSNPQCPSPLHESSYHSQESPSPSASSTRIDLYDDSSTLPGSRTQSQSPPYSGSPSYRLSFASRSLTRSTHKRSTTCPSQSGSSLPTPWGMGEMKCVKDESMSVRTKNSDRNINS